MKKKGKPFPLGNSNGGKTVTPMAQELQTATKGSQPTSLGTCQM